ncbi:MAG: CopD family protein [Chloroflexi bacterium]|nr:CopD family protein [Chloroflexota bacterium]
MYQLAVFVHLLAAVIWVGGMVFLALVLVPVTRGFREPPGFPAQLLSAAARRFRAVGWISLGVLVGSGIWLLTERGFGFDFLLRSGGGTAQLLRIKLLLVAIVVALSALHDFILGPVLARKLVELRANGVPVDRVARQRRVVSWVARLNLLLALGVIGAGVLIARGL